MHLSATIFTPTKHVVSEHGEGQQWMSASATRTVSALRNIVVLSLSTDAAGEKNTSKAIWKEKGSRILNVLKGDPAAQDYSATFKF